MLLTDSVAEFPWANAFGFTVDSLFLVVMWAFESTRIMTFAAWDRTRRVSAVLKVMMREFALKEAENSVEGGLLDGFSTGRISVDKGVEATQANTDRFAPGVGEARMEMEFVIEKIR